MKARLEFNLPDEKCDFNIASRAMDWALSLYDIDQKLRAYQKYGHTFTDADDAVEVIRNFLHETMSERGISMEDIE